MITIHNARPSQTDRQTDEDHGNSALKTTYLLIACKNGD